MTDFSTFFASVILPEKPCTFTVPEDADFTVTNLALDQAAGLPTEGRVVVYCSVNGAPPVCVAPFTLGKFESTQVSLRFCYSDRVEFTTKGAAVSVNFAGFLEGCMGLDVDNGAPKDEGESGEA